MHLWWSLCVYVIVHLQIQLPDGAAPWSFGLPFCCWNSWRSCWGKQWVIVNFYYSFYLSQSGWVQIAFAPHWLDTSCCLTFFLSARLFARRFVNCWLHFEQFKKWFWKRRSKDDCFQNMCQHLVVILHPILVVCPAVSIFKNPPASSQRALNSVVVVNHPLQCNVFF